MKFSPAPLLLATCLLAACGTKPPATLVEESKEAKQSDEEADAAAKAQAEADALAKNQLTPEELELIEQDPANLSPELKRKRSYAMRKRIMQNPNSPAALALEDARKAALAGELQLEDKPSDPNDNGVVIPAPDYLRSDKPLGTKDSE